jgi:hypothetical protein
MKLLVGLIELLAGCICSLWMAVTLGFLVKSVIVFCTMRQPNTQHEGVPMYTIPFVREADSDDDGHGNGEKTVYMVAVPAYGDMPPEMMAAYDAPTIACGRLHRKVARLRGQVGRDQ